MALYFLRHFVRYFVCHNGVFVDDISNPFLRQPVVLLVRKKRVTGLMCQIQPVLGDIRFHESSCVLHDRNPPRFVTLSGKD